MLRTWRKVRSVSPAVRRTCQESRPWLTEAVGDVQSTMMARGESESTVPEEATEELSKKKLLTNEI